MGLQESPAFFAFSRPPFAARLRAAEPLSAEAGLAPLVPRSGKNGGVGVVLQDDFEFELDPAGCDS